MSKSHPNREQSTSPGTHVGRRETILEAARGTFAASGYDGSSLRAIAAKGGVDPALLLYYYDTKEGLYRAAVERPYAFVGDLRAALAAPTSQIAAARWASALRHCSRGADALACRALLRSTSGTQASELTSSIVDRLVVAVAGEHTGAAARRQAAHALSRLFGWILLREILGTPALTGQTVDAAGSDLTAAIGRLPHENAVSPL
jgi:AcrR family transcriptional regulator